MIDLSKTYYMYKGVSIIWTVARHYEVIRNNGDAYVRSPLKKIRLVLDEFRAMSEEDRQKYVVATTLEETLIQDVIKR